MHVLREYIQEVLQENEATQDPLVAAIGDNRNFRVVESIPTPQDRNDTIYYISSGARGVRYTLRTRYLDWQGGEDGDYVMRDYHVTTLGTPKYPERAVKKALRLVSGRESEGPRRPIFYTPIDLSDAADASQRVEDKIKFGKYAGQTIADVIEQDPGYIAWMYSAIKGDKPNTVKRQPKYFQEALIAAAEASEAVMAVVKQRQEEYEEKKRGWAAEKEARRKAAEMRANSQHVGRPKQRLDMVVTYEGSSDFERASYSGYGMETVYIHRFRDEDGNAIIWWTGNAFGDYVEDDQGYSNWQKYNVGDKFRIKATVKKHGEYKGEKNTVVTRVKVVEKL